MRFVLVALLCAGCASVNPVTAWKMSRLDPLTADPADFAVRVEMPNGLRVPDGAAYLEMMAIHDGSGAVSDGKYVLRQDGAVWAIDAQDWSRMRAQQGLIRDWKAGDGATGSLSVQVFPCAVDGGPAPDATFDIEVQIEQGGAFLPLLTDAPMSEIGVEVFAPCDAVAG